MSTDQTSAPATGGIGLRSERGPVLLAMMLSTALIAVDSTILATAVPSIVADLGGFAEFPWLFSVYLLAVEVGGDAGAGPAEPALAVPAGKQPVLAAAVALPECPGGVVEAGPADPAVGPGGADLAGGSSAAVAGEPARRPRPAPGRGSGDGSIRNGAGLVAGRLLRMRRVSHRGRSARGRV